jgi:hypothetical protein
MRSSHELFSASDSLKPKRKSSTACSSDVPPAAIVERTEQEGDTGVVDFPVGVDENRRDPLLLRAGLRDLWRLAVMATRKTGRRNLLQRRFLTVHLSHKRNNFQRKQ